MAWLRCPHQVLGIRTALKRERFPLAHPCCVLCATTQHTLPSAWKAKSSAKVIPQRLPSEELPLVSVFLESPSSSFFVRSQIAGYRSDRNAIDLTLFRPGGQATKPDITGTRQTEPRCIWWARALLIEQIVVGARLGPDFFLKCAIRANEVVVFIELSVWPVSCWVRHPHKLARIAVRSTECNISNQSDPPHDLVMFVTSSFELGFWLRDNDSNQLLSDKTCLSLNILTQKACAQMCLKICIWK